MGRDIKILTVNGTEDKDLVTLESLLKKNKEDYERVNLEDAKKQILREPQKDFMIITEDKGDNTIKLRDEFPNIPLITISGSETRKIPYTKAGAEVLDAPKQRYLFKIPWNILHISEDKEAFNKDAKEKIEMIKKRLREAITIGIIGTGHVGKSLANELYHYVKEPLSEIRGVVYTKKDKKAKNIIRDIEGGIDDQTIRNRFSFKENLEEIANEAEIIVVAARSREYNIIDVIRRNSNPREEVFNYDKSIIKNIGEKLKGYTGTVLVVTNPISLMCELMHRSSGIERERIVGLTYSDSIRLVDSIMEKGQGKLTKKDIEKVVVIGEHGPRMVALLSNVRIKGEDFDKSEFSNMIPQLYRDIKYMPNVIIKQGGYTEGVTTKAIIESIKGILNDHEMPFSVYDANIGKKIAQKGENPEEFKPCYIGMPVKFNKRRVSDILNLIVGLGITEGEKKKLRECYQSLRKSEEELLDTYYPLEN